MVSVPVGVVVAIMVAVAALTRGRGGIDGSGGGRGGAIGARGVRVAAAAELVVILEAWMTMRKNGKNNNDYHERKIMRYNAI